MNQVKTTFPGLLVTHLVLCLFTKLRMAVEDQDVLETKLTMGRQNRFAEDKIQRKDKTKGTNSLLLVVAQNRGRQFNLFCGDMYKAQYQASQK